MIRRSGTRLRGAQEAAHEQHRGDAGSRRGCARARAASTRSSGPTGEITPALLMSTALRVRLARDAPVDLVAGALDRRRIGEIGLAARHGEELVRRVLRDVLGERAPEAARGSGDDVEVHAREDDGCTRRGQE